MNQTQSSDEKPKKPGRKPKYASAAEKQRAYRRRVKAMKVVSDISDQTLNAALDYARQHLKNAPEWVREALDELARRRTGS